MVRSRVQAAANEGNLTGVPQLGHIDTCKTRIQRSPQLHTLCRRVDRGMRPFEPGRLGSGLEALLHTHPRLLSGVATTRTTIAEHDFGLMLASYGFSNRRRATPKCRLPGRQPPRPSPRLSRPQGEAAAKWGQREPASERAR